MTEPSGGRTLRSRIGALPGVGAAARRVASVVAARRFSDSATYWTDRYRAGGTSGSGSYGELAEMKAGFLNDFVREHGIRTVIELGCGDGNQLTYADYPAYTGVDISPEAIAQCTRLFADDPTKEFLLSAQDDGRSADLSLSLDVVYHLTEDEVFETYMRRLFDAGQRYVIVYSSNKDEPQRGHVRHRRFTDWVDAAAPGWSLVEHRPNPFPLVDHEHGSFADFFVFARDSGNPGT
jgi:cyclopropane fatty-acyl-phospholipid synthase-like methyltransferase